MRENFFHLELIMGEPIDHAKGTGSAKILWAPILAGLNFPPKYLSASKIRKVSTGQPPYAGIFFSLGTDHGRANRPCKGDGVCENTMGSNPSRINTFRQNFHYNIDYTFVWINLWHFSIQTNNYVTHIQLENASIHKQ